MTASGTALATRLREASEAFVTLIAGVSSRHWNAVPASDVWSVGKEAEHVAEAMGYHQWIVRLTIGDKVGSGRPALERARMTTALTPAEAVALIRDRTIQGVSLIESLSEPQLRLATRPPRAKALPLSGTIERVMIGHVRAHHDAVQAKLQGLGG